MAKPDGKTLLGKLRHIWEVDIITKPTEIGWGAGGDGWD
jgi:hypothetical protein